MNRIFYVKSAENQILNSFFKTCSRLEINQSLNYHGAFINSVDTLKSDSNLFLSAANDRICCIWDERNKVPASVLYRNEFSSLTSVSWHQKEPNYITVGTEMGTVYLLDKRHPDDFIESFHCFDSDIHRISYHEGNFAVCGESNEVVVLNSTNNSLKEIYRKEAHKNFVRGFAWYKDALYTCGFDKAIVKHEL